jgi:DNA transformation protein
MAVSGSYLSFVLDQLAALPDVVSRSMFGGIGIYSRGVFFAVIDNDTIFFKVDDALAVRYRERGMPPFAPIPGQKPMMSYYQVPVDVLESAEDVVRWARESLKAQADRSTAAATRRSRTGPRRPARGSRRAPGSRSRSGRG